MSTPNAASSATWSVTTVPADFSPEGQARRDRNTATVVSFYAFLGAKDVSAAMDLWTDDARILQAYPPQGAEIPPSIDGRTTILTGFQQIFAHFTDYRADIKALYPTVNPDIIVIEYACTAHLTNGQTYDGPNNIAVFEFRDEKIAVYHDYYNPYLFRTVIDAVSEPTR